MTDIAGVVLCGGAGRRLGADKALVSFDGLPLVERVAGRLATFADPIFVARGALPPLDVRYEHLLDAVPDSGPLGGIVAALRASTRPLLAVVAVDMPFASPEVFHALRTAWRGEDAVVAVDRFGPQVLHALYARSALPPLEAALSRRDLSVIDALGALNVRTLNADDALLRSAPDDFARNLNSLDDVDALRGRHDLRVSP